ncbi:hypothetical protein M406DRAFT_341225 [Cryphonectria parasitica EP155]|uniref:Kinetochore protein mis14 n=1 Tax=Cryphonectria parasitica (strain ATCC 38755 / EP155) TaxID=660469 RepID=A0A9P5CND8_CRYP1|nr:uncharacterized protein M406DRAFT_341225 [Cryphonectria parasitica EP155]KAF3763805.1 hypothetical protein M406DRAFT_341225 [Cryphonectria parasitica EP155]
MDGSAHRKIELQSPEDLTYLINNVRRAAAEHIGAAFPPVEGDDAQEDELRVRIEGMVNDYIHQTFTLAAPNLSINGFELDARTFPAVYLSDPNSSSSAAAAAGNRPGHNDTGPEVQYEPFDARKRARLEDLAREEEDLMREIAALKRRVPAAAARAYADGFWEGVKADEAALGEAREQAAVLAAAGPAAGEDEDTDKPAVAAAAAASANNKAMLEGLGRVERRENVRRGYVGVVDTLGRLKREMPAVVAKMERARVAGEYVVTER